MPIARIIAELEIPHAQSVKDRRQVVRSIKDRLRHSFNASVCELDEALIWNRATIGVAAISGSGSYLTGQCEAIERAIHGYAAQFGVSVTDVYAEVISD